jgi:hypothetical protein
MRRPSAMRVFAGLKPFFLRGKPYLCAVNELEKTKKIKTAWLYNAASQVFRM